jgi:hypothetical protein
MFSNKEIIKKNQNLLSEEKITLLDPKRSYNINIKLGSINKFDLLDLKNFILEFNEDKISFDLLIILGINIIFIYLIIIIIIILIILIIY